MNQTVEICEAGSCVRFKCGGGVCDISKQPKGNSYYVNLLSVPREKRWQGIGGELIDTVTKWAIKKQALILLTVATQDKEHGLEQDALYRFYIRHGFKQTSSNLLLAFGSPNAYNREGCFCIGQKIHSRLDPTHFFKIIRFLFEEDGTSYAALGSLSDDVDSTIVYAVKEEDLTKYIDDNSCDRQYEIIY